MPQLYMPFTKKGNLELTKMIVDLEPEEVTRVLALIELQIAQGSVNATDHSLKAKLAPYAANIRPRSTGEMIDRYIDPTARKG